MKEFRLVLGLLAVWGGLFAVAYCGHPVDLSDEIFVQNQGKALLWSVVANVVLGIGLLLRTSLHQARHVSGMSEEKPNLRKRILQAPWFRFVCRLGAVAVLFLLFPLVLLIPDPFCLRGLMLLFLAMGIVWVRMLAVYDDFPESSFKIKLLRAVRPSFDLKNIGRILLLADLLCVWLGLASKGITGVWMLYNPLYLVPALVALYFCLNKMRYFHLLFIWFMMFPALGVILDNFSNSQNLVLEESSLETSDI